jgi:hypothetical protein
MYSTRSGLILGFHGCDESVAREVIAKQKDLLESHNNYDWLGHGVYFWENSPERALEFAQFLKENPSKANNPIHIPSVIGAVIDLGLCFDLLDYGMLQLLKSGYEAFKLILETTGMNLPLNKTVGSSEDLLLRDLDCAVFETIYQFRIEDNDPPYVSVRGVFWEGSELYPNAGFREKDHIQVCIRNPNCIKGYFKPRDLNNRFNKV